jgi:hypothetical protein
MSGFNNNTIRGPINNSLIGDAENNTFEGIDNAILHNVNNNNFEENIKDSSLGITPNLRVEKETKKSTGNKVLRFILENIKTIFITVLAGLLVIYLAEIIF